jgi:signal peptidase
VAFSKTARDALLVAGLLVVVIGGLWAYAGVWPPAVIVESSSMMHDPREVPYGRVGTIDPGDLVVVKSVSSPDDVQTFVENGPARYGKPGDVLVYFRANDRTDTPIIHRAIAYVVVDGQSYRVRWDANAPCVGGAAKDPGDARWCVYGASGVTLPQIGLADYRPDVSGYVTKGDNPVTNTQADVVNGISHDAQGRSSIVHPEWVEGKARGELPWMGLIKLALAGKANEQNPPASYVTIGWASAPKDLWICLGVALAVLVGGPIAWDLAAARRARKGNA